jgi:sugar phosphate isomerase/epimerase
MRYGAMNFPIKPILDELEEIAALGFEFMELSMDPPQAHYTTIRQIKKSITQALKFHSMKLICHLPTFVSTADLTDSIRNASLQEMFSSLEVASELEAQKVVLHPGHIGGMGVFVMDIALKNAVESLEAIIVKAERLGLCICLENMFPKCQAFFEPNDFFNIFERFPKLKLTLDTGHANIGSQDGQRIFEFIKHFGRRIGHLHVSDNLGKRDDHLPIGAGKLDFSRIVKALKDLHYDDTVTLEIFSEDRSQLRKSRDSFQAMLAES